MEELINRKYYINILIKSFYCNTFLLIGFTRDCLIVPTYFLKFSYANNHIKIKNFKVNQHFMNIDKKRHKLFKLIYIYIFN